MMKKDLSREESIRAFEAALRSSAPLPSFSRSQHIQEPDRAQTRAAGTYSKEVIYRVVERIKEL
jgi:hypothetical protein